MKIIVSTSNNYLHLIPVFTYLFNKYWSSEQEVTLLGYLPPRCKLPENFTFHSMGIQGDVSEWSTDLRKYFENIPDEWFIYLMEDCFIKSAHVETVETLYENMQTAWSDIGRFDLTNDIQKRPHTTSYSCICYAKHNSNYRFSTQASIWNKKFLLKYLTPGLSPWAAEKQECKIDGWNIAGLLVPPLQVNEGVRKTDIYDLDLNGFSDEDKNYIKTLL